MILNFIEVCLKFFNLFQNIQGEEEGRVPVAMATAADSQSASPFTDIIVERNPGSKLPGDPTTPARSMASGSQSQKQSNPEFRPSLSGSSPETGSIAKAPERVSKFKAQRLKQKKTS